MKTTKIAFLCFSIFFLSVKNFDGESQNKSEKTNLENKNLIKFNSKESIFKSFFLKEKMEIKESKSEKPLNYKTYWIEMYGSRFF
jgi:hypothetical protein